MINRLLGLLCLSKLSVHLKKNTTVTVNSDVPVILEHELLISLIQRGGISVWTCCFCYLMYFQCIYPLQINTHTMLFDLSIFNISLFIRTKWEDWQNIFCCKYCPVCRSQASEELAELTTYMFCILTSVGWKKKQGWFPFQSRFFFSLSWLTTSPSPPLTIFGKVGHERHLIFFSSFHSFINDHSCWSIEDSAGAFVWIPASEHVAAFPTAHVAHIIRRCVWCWFRPLSRLEGTSHSCCSVLTQSLRGTPSGT